jgi:glycosyltransferase involved in cell wall biosynthesis
LISVALPVRNESGLVQRNVRLVAELLDSSYERDQWELLVIDNQSTDDTFEKVVQLMSELPNLRPIRVPRKGVGIALITGWSVARGDALVYTDADLPFNLQDLKHIIDATMNWPGLVIGSRYAKGGSYKTSKLRRFLSISYIRWTNLLFNYNVSDNCGIKGIRKKDFLQVLPFIHSEDWFFGTEIIVACRMLNVEVKEVPVRCEDNDKRPSNVRVFATILKFIQLSLMLRIRLYTDSWKNHRPAQVV